MRHRVRAVTHAVIRSGADHQINGVAPMPLVRGGLEDVAAGGKREGRRGSQSKNRSQKSCVRKDLRRAWAHPCVTGKKLSEI